MADARFLQPQGLHHTPPSFHENYAGFMRRAAAFCVDIIVLFVIKIIYNVITNLLAGNSVFPSESILSTSASSPLLFVAAILLYSVLFESSSFQGTPGKLFYGLRVVDLNGRQLSFGRALGRRLAKILTTLTINLGYFLLFLSPRKQTLHDKVAGCLVLAEPRPRRVTFLEWGLAVAVLVGIYFDSTSLIPSVEKTSGSQSQEAHAHAAHKAVSADLRQQQNVFTATRNKTRKDPLLELQETIREKGL